MYVDNVFMQKYAHIWCRPGPDMFYSAIFKPLSKLFQTKIMTLYFKYDFTIMALKEQKRKNSKQDGLGRRRLIGSSNSPYKLSNCQIFFSKKLIVNPEPCKLVYKIFLTFL